MKRIITCLLSVLVLFNLAFPVHAEDSNDDETINLIATFYAVTTQENHMLDVPFNASWFKNDARIYNHDLAKLSLGLATSAFRPNKNHMVENRSADYNLRHFLHQGGFEDLRSDDYDKDPSMYTVSTVMGHRTVGEGDDAFELIAVGICGQGYMDEWESNLSIGTKKNPEGFYSAAHLVYDRVFGYISEKHLNGKMKIWLSGFSRAAAVSNITASMLSDSDAFSRETVFAYTFATPRTVREEHPETYENIFNICGKMDPVTNMPFADWGYSRYGVTYYTPALETDSDFLEKRKKADQVYEHITGISYWMNPDMNAQLRNLMDCMLNICPDVNTYREHLQDNLISLWEDHDALSVMSGLLKMAEDPILINDENRHDANVLMNQIAYLALDYLSSENSFRRYNTQASIGSNFLQAHTPELYISWVYSADDPSDLYSNYDVYSQLYVEGNTEVSISRNGELLEKYAYVDEMDEDSYHYLSMHNDKITVLVPRDKTYNISIRSAEDQSISVMAADFQAGHHAPDQVEKTDYDAKTGDVMELVLTDSGKTEYPGGFTSVAIEYETAETAQTGSRMLKYIYRNMDISWRDLVLTFIEFALITIAILTFNVTLVFMWLRHRHKRKRGFIPKDVKFRPLPIVCTFLIQLIFIIKEFYAALYPAEPDEINLYKAIMGFLLLIIAFYGYRRRKDRFHLLIMAAVLLLTASDFGMTVSITAGALLYIAAYILLCYNYVKEDPPGKSQIALFLVMSAASIWFINNLDGDFGHLRYIAILYVISGSALVATSFTRSSRTSRGSLMLFAAGILLILNTVTRTTFISHLIASGMYYIGVMTLAGTGSGFARPRVIPEYLPSSEQKTA
ncbi:MAG: hypothetical protein IKF00_02925 [Solobacterium sp.]|nr:hypothetical protein [Solobacterium sp.]